MFNIDIMTIKFMNYVIEAILLFNVLNLHFLDKLVKYMLKFSGVEGIDLRPLHAKYFKISKIRLICFKSIVSFGASDIAQSFYF